MGKLYERQQNKIDESNIRENLKRFKYDYEIGNKVLLKRDVNDDIIRKMDYVNEALYRITKVYSDGTIRIQRGNNIERLNIRLVVLYFELLTPFKPLSETTDYRTLLGTCYVESINVAGRLFYAIPILSVFSIIATRLCVIK